MAVSSWLIYALLSALCAAFVSIFGKVGLTGLDSSAATAVRAAIMALFLMGVVVAEGHTADLPQVFADKKALAFVALSGIAGALSGSSTLWRSRRARSHRSHRSTS